MPCVLQDRGADTERADLRKKTKEGQRNTERDGKMSLSVFEYKEVIPDDNALADVLGPRKELWDLVKEHIRSNYKDVSGEWKYYSRSAGWTFIVKSGKRTLIYLIPMKGYFKTNFVFGDAAVNAVLTSDLPAAVIKIITDARPYIEGRSFMTDVKNSEDVGTIVKLIGIKAEN